MKKIKFIDLFAGLGGLRLGFENAFLESGYETECVLTSEIKPYAVDVLKSNFDHNLFVGDITKVKNEEIPPFDFLLAGFPCQPFSSGGKRHGFLDTRGTLFFEILRILKNKNPEGFILENVEGLVKHDLAHKADEVGKTLSTILSALRELTYQVSWSVIDSINFGLPQSRKRVFIVGTKNQEIDLSLKNRQFKPLREILETGLDTIDTNFTRKLLSHFQIKDLLGKSIKDKRGGANNIHSWDFALRGEVSEDQVVLLNQLFKERRKKHWAEEIGIDWMDGMALTLDQIATFFEHPELEHLLDDLVSKGYLRFEHPKKLIREDSGDRSKTHRVFDLTKPQGYNIVTGKLSFEINKILDPNGIAPTLVATDASRLAVPDNGGLRRLTMREGLRLFGYPDWYQLSIQEKEAYDLLGNTVAIPVVEHVASKIAENLENTVNHFTSREMPVCSA